MKTVLPITLRAAFTFVAMMVIQYMIPYHILTLVGIGAGFFLYKTGDDQNLAIGVLIGSILFGIFAFITAQYYPIG
jgi:hypothetical protein